MNLRDRLLRFAAPLPLVERARPANLKLGITDSDPGVFTVAPRFEGI